MTGKILSYDFCMIICAYLFSLFLLCTPALAEKLYFDINSPFMRKIPIAIMPFDTGNNFENNILARKLTNIIRHDLDFQGFFSVSDQTNYDKLLESDWQKAGIEYAIKGNIRRTEGKVVAELRLIDSATGKMRTGRRYRASSENIRMVAHRFCDLVVEAVTGTRGVSSTRIFFIRKSGNTKAVYSSDFDGFNLRKEVYDKSINLSASPSPDGRFLVYTSFTTGRPCIYLKDMKSGTVNRISSRPGLNISPAWHPDNSSLAVALSIDSNPSIYQINLHGDITGRLTNGPGINVSPSWSPDGKMIAFVSDRLGTPQIFIKPVQRGAAQRLTYNGTYNTEPSWSPDGRHIAYTGRVKGRFQIFVIPANGGSAVQLTYDGSNEHPSWSPDSRHIVFTSTRQGRKKQLMTMLSDGSNQQRLPVDGEIFMPVWSNFVQ